MKDSGKKKTELLVDGSQCWSKDGRSSYSAKRKEPVFKGRNIMEVMEGW